MIHDRVKWVIFLTMLTVFVLLPQWVLAEDSEYVQFSHPGGFYSHEFSLMLSPTEPGGEIRYTLDGSEPTIDSILYTDPIAIVYHPDHDGGIAYIETTMELVPDFMEWRKPKEEPYKATVVRARWFSSAGSVGPVVTQTYFTAGSIMDRFAIPVIAITADPEGFFSSGTGIYVPGDVYIQRNTGQFSYGQQPANYNQRGDEWERSAHIAWHNPDGTLGFAQDVGIRIHGSWSRVQPMKSVRVYARSEYGEGKIDFPVFEGDLGQKYDCLILRNGGQDYYRAYLRDMVAHSMMDPLEVDIQKGRPVVVFINGVYWGIHYIRERFDERYFEKYYGIDSEQLILLENNSVLVAGDAAGPKIWRQLLNDLRKGDLAAEDQYLHLLQQIDLDSFLEQLLLGIYTANQDWPGNNVRFWRVQDPDETETAAKGMDGRWRWLINDLDVGFYAPEFNMYDRLMMESNSYPAPAWSTLLFRSLMRQEDFRSRFLSRLDYHLNSTFSAGNVLKWVDYWQKQLRPEMAYHIGRWQFPATLEIWESNVDEVREFAEKRPAYVRRQTEEAFGLEPSHRLTVSFSCEKGGDVWVHGIAVSSEQTQWDGEFFTGTYVQLEAVPRAGFQFVGWETGEGKSLEDFELYLETDMEIRPVFQRMFWAQIPVLIITGAGTATGLYFGILKLIRSKRKKAHEQLLTSGEAYPKEVES